ncbi:hypothetical protein N7539_007611 [Penicillium diatomitis]|uniref:Uncharacterized protein n=1 Tax=Penicillium diatomitis TaxID=2819901 RepID=A0A9W9WVT4_9EURO|nr:uncharacterized protein N7539_007611 [Penicillium diatomitis]KAJ5477467.1 hypothetical protein N7539_007611 [Penicillium diatomitis]
MGWNNSTALAKFSSDDCYADGQLPTYLTDIRGWSGVRIKQLDPSKLSGRSETRRVLETIGGDGMNSGDVGEKDRQ